jgi:hypothetical protein
MMVVGLVYRDKAGNTRAALTKLPLSATRNTMGFFLVVALAVAYGRLGSGWGAGGVWGGVFWRGRL